MLVSIPTPVPKLGQIFTRRWVAEVLLDLGGYRIDQPLEDMTVVEPSVGEGAILAPILERLLERALGRGIPLRELKGCVRAYDLDPRKLNASRDLARDALETAGATLTEAQELVDTWLVCADYLGSPVDMEVDLVVGNPPYIRYDDLAPGQFAGYQALWPTLSGRGDIYVGFWEKALASLKPDGVVSFICADRWMRNTYGARLRELVGESFAVRAVWTMHDVDAFQAKVSSYPAITVIANERQRAAVVADTTADFGEKSAQELARWTLKGRGINTSGPGYTAFRTRRWYAGRGLWPTGSPERLALLDRLETLPTLEQAGVTVGIGIASGADSVYIVHDAPVENSRLLPLATRESLTSEGLRWAGEHLVNPWEEDGTLVSLPEHPRMATYLASSPLVAERHVAKKNPDRWHRTIDRVIPGLAETPKILIPDMRPHLQPYLDEGRLYPHHNLYWLTSENWDLRVLGGLLLSDIAQQFVEAYCVRMRGGTLRLQAQYLRKIRVPAPSTVSENVARELADAFGNRDRARASMAARYAYGLNVNTDDRT